MEFNIQQKYQISALPSICFADDTQIIAGSYKRPSLQQKTVPEANGLLQEFEKIGLTTNKCAISAGTPKSERSNIPSLSPLGTQVGTSWKSLGVMLDTRGNFELYLWYIVERSPIPSYFSPCV